MKDTPELTILITKPEVDYALLDSGEGEKLERFGTIVTSRPDPQALWPKKLTAQKWQEAVAVFSPASDAEKNDTEKSKWNLKAGVPERWQVELGGLKFWIKPTTFKHLGIFPEQVSNWQWISQVIKEQKDKVSVLNLFGYTGGATLTASKAGADVCHVDGSKTAITWARENAELNGLQAKPIRWILDDVQKFLKREIKRGVKYHGIIMDPPAFGRGPDGEIWKIEDDLLKLLDLIRQVLTPNPLFVLLNGYASGYSALGYKNILTGTLGKDFPGLLNKVEAGELTVQEQDSTRLLPAGIFARTSR